jgi:hypothetical protein
LENLTELEKFLKDREIFTKKNQLIV